MILGGRKVELSPHLVTISCKQCTVYSILVGGAFENGTKKIPTAQFYKLLSTMHARTFYNMTFGRALALWTSYICMHQAKQRPQNLQFLVSLF